MKHQKIKDEEFKSIIEAQIHAIDDLQLLILKGHILVEYAMNKFINDLTEDSFDIYKENFHFAQKIKLCKALGLFESTVYPLEETMTTLNKIRNSIAHYLEYDIEEINKLFSIFKKMSKDVRPIGNHLNEIEIMKELVPAICGLTMGIKLEKQRIERFNECILSNEMMKDENLFNERYRNFR